MKTIKGELIKRINRFTCQVKIGKRKEKAYLANSGRLRELLEAQSKVMLTSKKGKLPYKLVAVKKDKIWVSTDAHLVNRFFEKEILKGRIPFLKGWNIESKETRVNKSRIDFVLKKGNKKMFCEIKSCTLVLNNIALFPDAPTMRGIKHIKALINKRKEGYESSIVFVVQREDAEEFAPNSLTHPDFSKTLYNAIFEGVKIYLIITRFNPYRISLQMKLYKKLDILNILKNEYHIWRYPEVFISKLKKSKNRISIEMKGTTCHHCSFEENLFDFIGFAKERGVNFKINKIKSGPDSLKAEILWRF